MRANLTHCSTNTGISCVDDSSLSVQPGPAFYCAYSGVHFTSAVLFSVFLGFCGIDRFYMGYAGVGAAKLLTLGGIGVWWIVDTALLLGGVYVPAHGDFEYEPFTEHFAAIVRQQQQQQQQLNDNNKK